MFLGRRELLVLAAGLSLSCNKPSDKEGKAGAPAPVPSQAGPITLNGAGATFPYPLYSKWMAEYNKEFPNIRINYQSIGSGGGIRQIIAGTVDFGASDAPMKADESKQAPGKLLHIPATIGSVVVSYNLPEVSQTLKLSSGVVADIYLGTIKKWNDPKISADNPDAKLPGKVARWSWSERQRGRCWSGQDHALYRWLHRARLRDSEQAADGRDQEQGRQVRFAFTSLHVCRRRRRGNACGAVRFARRLRSRKRISNLRLHLSARLRRRQGPCQG
jgi:hypothetical protein